MTTYTGLLTMLLEDQSMAFKKYLAHETFILKITELSSLQDRIVMVIIIIVIIIAILWVRVNV